jgi:hypothetical protein
MGSPPVGAHLPDPARVAFVTTLSGPLFVERHKPCDQGVGMLQVKPVAGMQAPPSGASQPQSEHPRLSAGSPEYST